MSGAWAQRQSDGSIPRMSDGSTVRSTSDATFCCCAGGCNICTGPTPTDYDCTFTGVTKCPDAGIPAIFSTAERLHTAAGLVPSQPCTFSKDVGDASQEVMNLNLFSATDTEVSMTAIAYFARWNYFASGAVAYTDCTSTYTASNSITSSTRCIITGTPGDSIGYGGSVSCVPVLPP